MLVMGCNPMFSLPGETALYTWSVVSVEFVNLYDFITLSDLQRYIDTNVDVF